MAQIQVVEVCNCCESQENVDWYCIDCDEILCTNCKKIHLKTKKLKNDNIIPIKEAKTIQKSPVILCTYHPFKECMFYCNTCQEPICGICYHDNHQDHKWTLIEQYTSSKRESLKGILNELKLVDPISSEAVTTEGRSHNGLKRDIDEANNKINQQEATAKENISKVCDRYRSVLSEMKENENKRYAEACNRIQNQNLKVQTTIHRTQTVIDKGDFSQLIQTEMEAKQCLQETSIKYQPLKLTIPRFLPGIISEQAIINVIGVLETDTTPASNQTDDTEEPENSASKSGDEGKGARPKVVKTRTDKTDLGARPKQRQDDYKQPQNPDRKQEGENVNRRNKAQNQEPELRGDKTDRDKEHEIDVTKVKVKSVIQGKSGIIRSIVPVNNNRMWVVQDSDDYLTLIDCHGHVVKKSVTVDEGSYIHDTKLYNSDLVIICHIRCKITRMSSDGSTTSSFSDLSPYYILGLCIGHNNDVLVTCVKYASDRRTVTESKIVRLNESGSIVQTIQYDHTGAPLFTEPYSLTSPPSGDIMVIDQYKVTAVDREGKHLFTWDGQEDGINTNKYNLNCITHDRHSHVFVTDYNNDKVYVIDREGRGGKCLLDHKQGILGPWGIAINHDGQLLVGCYPGKVHIIDY